MEQTQGAHASNHVLLTRMCMNIKEEEEEEKDPISLSFVNSLRIGKLFPSLQDMCKFSVR